MTGRPRDIYGRKPTSTSRGKTQQRIMNLQRADGTLPGSDGGLDGLPAGSIGAGMSAFLAEWVTAQPVTSRRAYERALVFLQKDLEANGPALAEPAEQLGLSRLAQHLAWRVEHGLDHPGELVRTGAHLARLGDWLDHHHDAGIKADRDHLRGVAEGLLDPKP